MPRTILAENIKALMDYRELTQAAVAHASGLTQKQISRIVRQEQEIGIDKLQKLATGFKLIPWQLLVDELDPANIPVLPLSEEQQVLYKRFIETAAALGMKP